MTEPVVVTTVLRGATVLDGNGGPPKSDQTIVVRGREIIAVGASGRVDVPSGAHVVNVSGKWIVPGFIDLHVHFPEDASVHDAMLRRFLEFGITTILNPGARPGAGVALRERIRSGDVVGPRMFTAGRLIDVAPENRDASGWGADTPTVASIQREVKIQSEQVVDFIKLYAGVPPELARAAIEESHTRGIPVIGHLEATGWRDAALMGIDMLVHSGWATPMDEVISLDDPSTASDTEWYMAYAEASSGEKFEALAAALVANDVLVVPTLAVQQVSALGTDTDLLAKLEPSLAPEADVPGWWGEGWRDQHPYYGYESEEEAEMMATVYVPAILDILRAYYRAGVRIGVGTDVGNPWMTPGVSFHHELELYASAGIPLSDILKMATRNGAEAVGALQATGTIEAGKAADLVVLTADPSLDIRNTRTIESVFLDGELVFER